MEPSGDRSKTTATPVELVVVDEEAQATVSPAEKPTPPDQSTIGEALTESTPKPTKPSVADESSETVTEASRPVSAPADSRRSAISPSQGVNAPPSRPPTVSGAVQPQVPSTDDPVGGDSRDSAAGQTPVATQADSPLPAQETGQGVAGQGNDSTPAEPQGESTELAAQAEDSQAEDSQLTDSSQLDSSQAEDSQTEDVGAESEAASSTASEAEPGVSSDNGEDEGAAGQIEDNIASEPPIVEGEQLPAPSTMPGEEAPQVAALEVVGTEINIVQDQKDVPPRLLNASGTITLQPESLGCGQVDFAQGPLTYRLAINADSTLRAVTPVPLDERRSVQAVACLIRAAEFRFEPAMSEGTPVLDDSLLMTVQVIESPLE
ncbi:MAG: hypothetical protein AAGC93_08145 [Cyanobacteria bacterium P01_F01_bin.53]